MGNIYKYQILCLNIAAADNIFCFPLFFQTFYSFYVAATYFLAPLEYSIYSCLPFISVITILLCYSYAFSCANPFNFLAFHTHRNSFGENSNQDIITFSPGEIVLPLKNNLQSSHSLD